MYFKIKFKFHVVWCLPKVIYPQKSNLKAGMIKTGYFKEAFYRSGKYYDVEIFSITKINT